MFPCTLFPRLLTRQVQQESRICKHAARPVFRIAFGSRAKKIPSNFQGGRVAADGGPVHPVNWKDRKRMMMSRRRWRMRRMIRGDEDGMRRKRKPNNRRGWER